LIPLLTLLGEQAELEATATALARAGVVAGQLTTIDGSALPSVAPDGFPTTIFLPDGRTVGVPLPRPAAYQTAVAGETVTTHTGTGVEVLVPASVGGGVAVVRVGANPPARSALPVAVIVLALGITVVTIAVADRLALDSTVAIAAMAAAAERIAAGDTAARALPAGPPEVRRLGAAVNRIAIQVDHFVAAQRREGSDLAHRLRTPLTALELDISALPESTAARKIATDLRVLTTAVNSVISTSRRSPQPRPVEPVSLGAVVRERVRFWSALAEETGRATESAIDDEDCPVNVARPELEAAVDALLANVFAHTPAGTAFRVDVRRTGHGAVLVVEDRGPGFTRPDSVRRGRSGSGSTGLGLDIVRRTAETAGGSVRTGPAPGGGARVEVLFGLADGPPRGSWLRRH